MKIQLLSLSYYLFYAATTATTTTTAAAASKTVSATTSVVVVAKAVGSNPNSLIAAAIAAVSVSVSVSAAAAAPFILTVPYSFTTGTINPYLGCSRCNRYRENREHRLQRLQKTTLQLQRTSISSTSTAKKRKTRRRTFCGDSCSFIHPTTTFTTRRLKGHYLRSSSPLVSFLSSKSSSSLSSLLSAEQEQNRIHNNNNNDDDDTTIVGASTTKKSEQERPQEEDDCDGLYRPFAEWGWEKILSTFPKFDDDHNDDGNNNTNNTNNNEQPYVEEIYIDPEFSMTLSTPTPIPISTSSNNTNTTTSTTSTAVRITIRALKGCSTGAATTTNKKTSCPIRYARYALLETVHIRTMQDNDDKIEQHDKMMDYTDTQQTTLSGDEKGIQQKYLSSKGTTTTTTTTIKTGIQVLNMVIFPSIDSDLPVWGADFVTLPGNKNLILLDAQPMNIVPNNNNNMNKSKNNSSEDTSNSNSSVDNSSTTENSTMPSASASTSTSSYSDRWDEWYLEHITNSSSSSRVLFPWGGDLPEQVQQYVSKNALWTRMNYYNTNNTTTAGDSTGSSNNSNSNSATIPSASNVTAIIEGPLYKAFQDHLQIYLDTLQDWKKETEKQQQPKQTQKEDQAFYPRHHHHHHHQQQQQQQQQEQEQEQEQHLDNSTSTCNKQSMYVQYRLENDPARPMLNRLYGKNWTETVLEHFLFPK